jgi:protein transport protein SEC13
MNTIASAGQDGKVFLWAEDASGSWSKQSLHDFQGPIWRVSWSVTGNLLAVSDSKQEVSLWKEGVDGRWQQI